MHPFQSEMMTRVVLDDRRREAPGRRRSTGPVRRQLGTLLVGTGERITGAGRRLQHTATGERPEPTLRSAC